MSSSTTSRVANVTKIDVARRQAVLDNDVVGHYVYGVEWSQDGTALVIERANRRQHIVEFAACRPATGACRTVVHEEWTTGWLNASIDPIQPVLAPPG